VQRLTSKVVEIIRGFSLIELMIVIAIIGVLAGIAIPSYNSYISRTKLLDGLSSLKKVKDEATVYFNINGTMPVTVTDINLTSSSFTNDDITGFFITNGPCANSGSSGGSWCATLTYSDDVTGLSSSDSGKLMLAATISGLNLTWECITTVSSQPDSIPGEALPSGCNAAS